MFITYGKINFDFDFAQLHKKNIFIKSYQWLNLNDSAYFFDSNYVAKYVK